MAHVTFKIFSWSALVAGIYVLASQLIPLKLLLTVLNGAFLGLAILVIITYFPLLCRMVAINKFDRTSQMTLAIAVLWCSLIVNRVWWAVYNIMGKPAAWSNSSFVGLVIVLGGASAILFVSAPGNPPVKIDRSPFDGFNRKAIFLFAIIGGLVGGLSTIWVTIF